MDFIYSLLLSTGTSILAVSILAFLAKNLIIERLKTELQKEHSRFLTELQWDKKVKEQAARVA